MTFRLGSPKGSCNNGNRKLNHQCIAMRTGVKYKGLKSENLGQLEKIIRKVKKGEVSPFKEKTERARHNLKKAGMIKGK